MSHTVLEEEEEDRTHVTY